MCGRFDVHSAIDIITKIFQIDIVNIDLKPGYNVAPSQAIGIVINNGSQNLLISSRRGFLPFWAKEKKTEYSMINARAQTVASNRSYKDAFVNHRCLIPADGFYEWLKQDKIKIPYYTRLKSKIPMGLAGLYNTWKSPEGEEVPSCTIITTDANSLMAPIHNRMPVILHKDDFRLWMDPAEHDKEVLRPLLKPFPSEELETYRVTTKVNSFKYDHPDDIEPIP